MPRRARIVSPGQRVSGSQRHRRTTHSMVAPCADHVSRCLRHRGRSRMGRAGDPRRAGPTRSPSQHASDDAHSAVPSRTGDRRASQQFPAHALCRLHQARTGRRNSNGLPARTNALICAAQRSRKIARHRPGPIASNSVGSLALTRTSAADTRAIRSRKRRSKWLLEGARRAGLICDQIAEIVAISNRAARSARFVRRVRVSVLDDDPAREALYRTIDPVPEVRANRRRSEDQPGFTLASINEHVDESVVRYWESACESSPEPRSSMPGAHAARHRRSRMAPIATKSSITCGWATRSVPIRVCCSGPRSRQLASSSSTRCSTSGRRRRLPGLVCNAAGRRVRACRLGGERSELHDCRARRVASPTGVPRLHLLDARPRRRLVPVWRGRRAS